MISRLLKIGKWFSVGAVSLLLLSFSNSTHHLNPAQEVAAPYNYNIAKWEFSNFLSKWTHRVDSFLPWYSPASNDRQQLVRDYFGSGQELGDKRRELRSAAARGDSNEVTDALEAELDALEAGLGNVTSEVEETIEATVSAVLADEGLATFGEFIFPPVDIHLGDPPKLLVTSPRDRIERTHDVLLDSDVRLDQREEMERRLFQESDLAALVEDIGGLATYPASIPTAQPMRWTVQTAAHEWLHHYFFFRPLGQNMFNDSDMVSLNETIAGILGNEIGDRAFEALGGEIPPPPPELADTPAPAPELNGEEEGFNFSTEMRETRLKVEELLADGRIEGAEAYMEERRKLFVENGYAIRKLNQAYFAFYGTYAYTAASISPIGGQVDRFRELVPDMGDFINVASGISSYQEFLDLLDELESKVPTTD